MIIRFNIDWNGSLDGINPSQFKSGEEAEIPMRIAAVLLEDGRASLPAAAKAIPAAPENKMQPAPAANKAGRPRKLRL